MSTHRRVSVLYSLLVVLIAVAEGHRSSYYYYYPGGAQHNSPSIGGNYYYTSPNQCYSTSQLTTNICPQAVCYGYQTISSCCISLISAFNQIYQTCHCSAQVACSLDAATTTTTSTTTTTTPTTTTTTPTTTTPTTTTTRRTTTTTRPTTTTTSTTTTSTTTTTTPTTTTTTPTTTTTTKAPFRSLCRPIFRLLNSQPVQDQCVFPGITNITDRTVPDNPAICNAVYTTAVVNGVLKETFVTDKTCVHLIKTVQHSFTIQIGSDRFPLVQPLFNITEGANGLSYITVDPYFSEITKNLGSCQKPACLYNVYTMSNLVDFENCTIVSWGATSLGSISTGLYQVSMTLNEGGCTNVPDPVAGANTKCFKTTSGNPVYCSTDRGAPMYCHAPFNGEQILIGVTASQFRCDNSSEIKIIPIY